MTKTIYLATSIDQGLEDSRGKAKEALLRASFAVFDPAEGWDVPSGGNPTGALQRGNLALLGESDGLLAILNPGVLTVGVVIEIMKAVNWQIPTVVYAPNMKPSWSLAYLGVTHYQNLDAAILDLKGKTN